MGKIIYFTFEKKSNTKNIRSNIRRKLRHFFTGTEKPLDFNSKLQKIDKVVKDKCPFNAHCPMGNARATKFLKGHCPTLPMPPFFLMGIARVCPCPKILPVKQHYLYMLKQQQHLALTTLQSVTMWSIHHNKKKSIRKSVSVSLYLKTC